MEELVGVLEGVVKEAEVVVARERADKVFYKVNWWCGGCFFME